MSKVTFGLLCLYLKGKLKNWEKCIFAIIPYIEILFL
jgi:hypothetical protein